MSLRLRLLVAVGLISIAALIVADFATYSALRNSLYNQVDQELAQHRPGVPINVVTNTLACQSPQQNGRMLNPFTGDSGAGGGGGPGGSPDGDNGGPNVSGIYYSALVNSSGTVVNGLQCPAYIGSHAYKPVLPSQISGFATEPDGSQVAYFSASSSTSGGPTFRVRAVKPAGTNVVAINAQPITDQNSTLHTLFLTELAVTAG
ncbi:MAG TPA: hypothetical protein VHZ05_00025, partial [Acidimicrobiales bacterium]|nr:hypothetical protein [Acidimicrobiales bacterium]